MSKNRDLYAEAIAEAKAVKHMAIENAKAALEEAFTPQLKSMFVSKIQEMEEEELEETSTVEMEEEMEMDEELNLDEILAEIENETTISEANEEEEEDASEEDEDAEAKEDDEDEVLNIEDMTKEDLEDLIEKIMLEEFPELAQMRDDEGEEEAEDELVDVEDEEVDLDEILNEIMDSKDDLDLDEILAEIEDEDEKEVSDLDEVLAEIETEVTNEEIENLHTELNEAKNTIKKLTSELDEINLLNAKLLYTNKLFKSKNLNESQKVKVLSSFDKTSSVKEVKLVFNTLNESLKVKTPNLTPKLGSASKAVAPKVTKKESIVESNDVFARMQKLAGII